MKSWLARLIVLLAIVAAGGGGYWLGHRKTADTDENPTPKPEEKPVASVSVTTIRRSKIAEEFTAYGTVIAPASEIQVVSVPFECRVTRTLATPGETVAAGQPLIEVQGSAATALAVEEATNASTAAQRDLQFARQRYDQKLATNAELFTAENTSRTARGRLQSLQQGGAGGPTQLKADRSGIVSKVDVQMGQIVPIGGPLVEVAGQHQIEVKLGVEPDDMPLLGPGQTVQLRRVNDADDKGIEGKIRLIAQRVDPVTRLVDVMVTLPADANLMLESFVVGRLKKASVEGLVVPREAVLPADEGGYSLFTISDNKAVKHTVNVGIETRRFILITGEGLKEGDSVVVSGNNILDDGMAVQVMAATQPAMDEPETMPSATAPVSSTEPATLVAATRPATSQPASRESSIEIPPTTSEGGK